MRAAAKQERVLARHLLPILRITHRRHVSRLQKPPQPALVRPRIPPQSLYYPLFPPVLLNPVQVPFVTERIENILKPLCLCSPRKLPIRRPEISLLHHPPPNDPFVISISIHLELPLDPFPIRPPLWILRQLLLKQI